MAAGLTHAGVLSAGLAIAYGTGVDVPPSAVHRLASEVRGLARAAETRAARTAAHDAGQDPSTLVRTGGAALRRALGIAPLVVGDKPAPHPHDVLPPGLDPDFRFRPRKLHHKDRKPARGAQRAAAQLKRTASASTFPEVRGWRGRGRGVRVCVCVVCV